MSLVIKMKKMARKENISPEALNNLLPNQNFLNIN